MQITIFLVTDMAMTVRYTGTLVKADEATRTVTFRPKGKRKDWKISLRNGFYTSAPTDVKVDSDFDSFSGNACLNLRSKEQQEVYDLLNDERTHWVTDNLKGCILWKPISAHVPEKRPGITVENSHKVEATILFPQIDVRHAVINRIKQAQQG